MIVQAVLVVLSTRLLGLFTSAAVGLELVIVVVLTVGLFVAVVVTGNGAVDNLTSRGITEGAPNYFAIGGGLMAAMIMGLATLVGFDSAANLAEEAKDPFRSVPRAIVGSVVAAGVLGLVFVIALTVAIKDVPGQRQRFAGRIDHPRSTGPVSNESLWSGIAIAMFGAGVVTLATAPGRCSPWHGMHASRRTA